MMTSRRPLALLFVAALSSACGGLATVPDETTTTTPPASTARAPGPVDVAPPEPDEPGPREGRDCEHEGIAWEPGPGTLSRLALPSMTLAPLGVLRCATETGSVERLEDLTITHEGTAYALTTNGYVARIGEGPSCGLVTRLPDADTRHYVGLAATAGPAGEELVTVRTGSSTEYARDGAYTHTLVALDPTTLALATRGTFGAKSYPAELDARVGGTLLVRYASTIVELDRTGATLRTFAPEGIAKWRATLATPTTLFAVGDVHDAPRGGGLPTYTYDLVEGATAIGPVIGPPSRSNALVVGARHCAATR